MSYVCLLLPFPPSVNSMTACVGGRSIKTARHRQYLVDACKAIQKQEWEEFTNPVSIKMSLGRPDKRKRDIDNHAKAPLDALVAMGVIDDDSLNHDMRIRWDEKVIGCMVEIESIETG